MRLFCHNRGEMNKEHFWVCYESKACFGAGFVIEKQPQWYHFSPLKLVWLYLVNLQYTALVSWIWTKSKCRYSMVRVWLWWSESGIIIWRCNFHMCKRVPVFVISYGKPRTLGYKQQMLLSSITRSLGYLWTFGLGR